MLESSSPGRARMLSRTLYRFSGAYAGQLKKAIQLSMGLNLTHADTVANDTLS